MMAAMPFNPPSGAASYKLSCLKEGMIPASHKMYYLWLNQKETVRTMKLSFSERADTVPAMENKKPGRWSELGKDMMLSL